LPPGGRRVVPVNPAIFKAGTPRTAIQLLAIPGVNNGSDTLRRGAGARDPAL